MLVLALLVGARILLAAQPRLNWRPAGWSLQTLRVFAAAAVVMAALLSPVLYAFGERVLSGNAELPPVLWRSSPPGVDLLALVLPNPTHPLWGESVRTLIERWSGQAGRVPRDGGLDLARGAERHRARRLVRRLAPVGDPGRLDDLLRLARARSVRPRRRLQHAVPDAVGGSALRAGPRHGAVARAVHPARNAGRDGAVRPRARPPGEAVPERRRGLLALVAVLLAVELVPAPRVLYSAAIPSIYQRIASDPRPRIRVLELPTGVRDGTSSLGNFNARTQYFQTAHGKAIVGGYLSRVSPRRKAANRRMPVMNALMSLQRRPDATRGRTAGGAGWGRGVPLAGAARLRGHRPHQRVAGARRLCDRAAGAHRARTGGSDGAGRAEATFATSPLSPIRPMTFGNTCSAFMRSPHAQTRSTFEHRAERDQQAVDPAVRHVTIRARGGTRGTARRSTPSR